MNTKYPSTGMEYGTLTRTIHGNVFFFLTLHAMVYFYGINVGKYTIVSWILWVILGESKQLEMYVNFGVIFPICTE